MLSTLAENIHDNRFLRLVRNMLQAGYLEDWEWNATLSGAPQGGVASPILSNIYLDRLDKFVETVLIPEYTQGSGRARNPSYFKVWKAITRARAQGNHPQARELRKLEHPEFRAHLVSCVQLRRVAAAVVRLPGLPPSRVYVA